MHKCGADAPFLCYISPFCRGAVGYTTGRMRPKTDGVIVLCDFSSTPTVISVTVFINFFERGVL